MKVEIKEVENAIDWTKSQVVVGCGGERFQVVTNKKSPDSDGFCGVRLSDGMYSDCWAKQAFKPETKQDFPIKLELTIESEQELCDLWHRMNASKTEIDRTASDSVKFGAKPAGDFWNFLHKLFIERNLYK